MRQEKELLDLQDLKFIYSQLEKKSFPVDLGYTETMAVELVEIEDMLINQLGKEKRLQDGINKR